MDAVSFQTGATPLMGAFGDRADPHPSQRNLDESKHRLSTRIHYAYLDTSVGAHPYAKNH